MSDASDRIPKSRSLVPVSTSLVLVSPNAHRDDEERKAARVVDDQANSLGLTKPANWPSVMAWPPATVREAIRQGKLTRQNSSKFQAYYDKYAEKTVDRAKKLAKHLETNQSLNEDVSSILFMRRKKKFDRLMGNLHENIGWAMLLDPHGEHANAYESMVMSWGRSSITTVDGGKIKTRDGSLQITKMSEQAIRMMVQEASARGWETMQIRGDAKFVQAVMSVAKESGMKVEATVMRFPYIFNGKKLQSNPVLQRDKDVINELAELRQNLSQNVMEENPDLDNDVSMAINRPQQPVMMG